MSRLARAKAHLRDRLVPMAGAADAAGGVTRGL
jgi:hypothetical protein